MEEGVAPVTIENNHISIEPTSVDKTLTSPNVINCILLTLFLGDCVHRFRDLISIDLASLQASGILYRIKVKQWSLLQMVTRLHKWTRQSDALACTIDKWESVDSYNVTL